MCAVVNELKMSTVISNAMNEFSRHAHVDLTTGYCEPQLQPFPAEVVSLWC